MIYGMKNSMYALNVTWFYAEVLQQKNTLAKNAEQYMKRNKMSLTELEKDVIKAIGGNQYADVPADPIWVFAVEYDTKIVTKKQISGVISSLS